MTTASISLADISAINDRITSALRTVPTKVLARIIGRSPGTVADCKLGRSVWRAADLVALMAANETLKTDIDALVRERATYVEAGQKVGLGSDGEGQRGDVPRTVRRHGGCASRAA